MNHSIDALEHKVISNPPKKRVQIETKKLLMYRIMIIWRFALAIFGGYVIAMYSALLIAEFFSETGSAAAMGATLIAFLLQAIIFIWVFMVNKTLTASLGILAPAFLLFITHSLFGA